MRAFLIVAVALVAAPVALGQRAPSKQEAYMRYSIGRLLEVQGHPADALVQYRMAHAIDPGACGTSAAIARVLVALERPEEAVEPISRARALCPEDQDILAVDADVLLALGDEAGAEAILSRPARADSSPAELVAALAQTLEAQGRVEEAEALYAERCRADSLSPILAFLHARVLSECGRDDEALRELERAERLDPENPAVSAALGTARYRAGDVEGAVESYERVLTHSPDSVPALNFIAYTLAESGSDLARALAYAERAASLDPANPDVRDTLGWVYFRLSRYADARRELEAAVELGATQAVVHEHLGDALMALGLAEEAVEAWQKALAIEPGRASSAARIEAARAAGAAP